MRNPILIIYNLFTYLFNFSTYTEWLLIHSSLRNTFANWITAFMYVFFLSLTESSQYTVFQFLKFVLPPPPPPFCVVILFICNTVRLICQCSFHFGFPLHQILIGFNHLFSGVYETSLWFCETEPHKKTYSKKCRSLLINVTLFPFPLSSPSSILPYFHSLFLSTPFPTFPKIAGIQSCYFWFILSAFFFCTNEELHVYFLIPPFFLRWRIAYYIHFWGLFIFHITICCGNHFVSLHRLFHFLFTSAWYSTMWLYHNLINHSMYEHFNFFNVS